MDKNSLVSFRFSDLISTDSPPVSSLAAIDVVRLVLVLLYGLPFHCLLIGGRGMAAYRPNVGRTNPSATSWIPQIIMVAKKQMKIHQLHNGVLMLIVFPGQTESNLSVS